jgi:hypothetical protein
MQMARILQGICRGSLWKYNYFYAHPINRQHLSWLITTTCRHRQAIGAEAAENRKPI